MPGGITAGPDGNLWFTEGFGVPAGSPELARAAIGRITLEGAITEFPLPQADSAPVGITAGPDGNLWFTESFSNKIGRVEILQSLVNSFNLGAGTANSLLSKLQAEQASLSAGNTRSACNQLNAFVHEVQAQSGKHLSVAQANQLIAAATGIRAVLGC